MCMQCCVHCVGLVRTRVLSLLCSHSNVKHLGGVGVAQRQQAITNNAQRCGNGHSLLCDCCDCCDNEHITREYWGWGVAVDRGNSSRRGVGAWGH